MQRDLVGYGNNVPQIRWPGDAQIAVSIVINYEEGSERNPLDGDPYHESNGEVPSPRRRHPDRIQHNRDLRRHRHGNRGYEGVAD